MAFSAWMQNFAARRGRLGLAAFLSYAFIGMAGCNSGTEVTDPYELAGRVTQENGQPAAGAKVIVLSEKVSVNMKVSAAASDVVEEQFDTVYTEKNGEYHFVSLPQGRHFLTVEEDTSEAANRWWTDGVYTHPGQTSQVSGKLKPPGELLLTVQDEADGSLLQNSSCEVKGTPYNTATATGVLHFFLPEGVHQVVCHHDGSADRSIYVEIASRTVKDFRINLGQGEAPVAQPFPDSVAAAYDSVTGVVTLTWSQKMPAPYVVYGIRRVDETLGGPAQQFLSADTVWRDNPYAATDTMPQKVLRYSIYCLKKDLLYKTPTPPIRVIATRPVTAHGPDLGMRFLGGDSVFKVGDTARVVASFRNPFRNNARLQWWIKDSVDSLRQVDVTGSQGEDTLAFPCLAPGNPEIGITVIDVAGFSSTLRKPFEIISAP